MKETKYQWQKSSGRTDNRSSKRRKFLALSQLTLKTARAWRIKETAAVLWDYTNMGVARKHWEALLRWISHSRLQPVIKVGQMVKRHLWGILNAIRLKKNNSMLEAKNARIQRIKKTVCGFRNKERFKQAILFHLRGLDVMPSPTQHPEEPAELQSEINSECPFYKNTDVGHFQIHHIDENTTNNEMENLILICPNCHSKVTKGDILQIAVMKKKNLSVNKKRVAVKPK